MVRERGFRVGLTMLELVTIIVIVAILAALALPSFEKTIDEGHKKEAKAMLNLIASAERVYHLERNFYMPFSNTTDVERLILQANFYNNRDWNYTVSASGSGDSASGTATAIRRRGRHSGDRIIIDVASGNITSEYTW